MGLQTSLLSSFLIGNGGFTWLNYLYPQHHSYNVHSHSISSLVRSQDIACHDCTMTEGKILILIYLEIFLYNSYFYNSDLFSSDHNFSTFSIWPLIYPVKACSLSIFYVVLTSEWEGELIILNP